MLQIRRVPVVFVFACTSLLAVGCGPTLSTSVRTETAFAPGNTGTLSKDGLTIEVPNLTQMPEVLQTESRSSIRAPERPTPRPSPRCLRQVNCTKSS
jgi:hypothetical protein